MSFHTENSAIYMEREGMLSKTLLAFQRESIKGKRRREISFVLIVSLSTFFSIKKGIREDRKVLFFAKFLYPSQ